MRYALLTASLFLSSSAFACGMYIPPEMKVADLGTLFETLEADTEVADVGPEVEFVDIDAAEAVVVPVQAIGFQAQILADDEAVTTDSDDRQARKAARKARKVASNS